MLTYIGFALLVGLIVWLFPLILAAAAVVFCLLMAGLCWIYELIIPLVKKKPSK